MAAKKRVAEGPHPVEVFLCPLFLGFTAEDPAADIFDQDDEDPVPGYDDVTDQDPSARHLEGNVADDDVFRTRQDGKFC